MILKRLKNLFLGTPTKTLPKHTKIRFIVPQWVNLDTKGREPVTIEKHCILIFLFEKKGEIYFQVKSLFYSNANFAKDGDIVTISKHRFNTSLKYKLL